jgi:hypothetical protein
MFDTDVVVVGAAVAVTDFDVSISPRTDVAAAGEEEEYYVCIKKTWCGDEW